MRRSALFVAAWMLMPTAYAGESGHGTAAIPGDWISLAKDETAIVFLLRSYGADTSFDVVDETGASIDEIDLPEGRTIILQYRVSPGQYSSRFFEKETELKTRPGSFTAYGIAVTHLPLAENEVGTISASYSPVAIYTPVALEQRVAPLAALGTTDFLAPRRLEAKMFEFRLSDPNRRSSSSSTVPDSESR
jgi:hypothetical protein